MLRGTTLTILFFLLGFSPVCFAAVSLSVNPIDGSNSLRFDKWSGAGNKKEIHIRVNAANGTRYQVFQSVLEPIVNEKGEALNLQAVETQTLANSNSSGMLYLQNPDHLYMSDQLLYSSSQGAESDGFMIGYSLNKGLMNSSGNFRGRLVFTVRGTDGTSDQATIDVFTETPPSLNVSVKGAHIPKGIHISNSSISDATADYLTVSFSGNTGGQIQIYQEVDTFPANQTQEELGQEVLQMDAQGQTDGLRVPGVSNFVNNKTLIYSSNKQEDSFNVYYLVNTAQVQQQAAGTYTGKIRYVVQIDQGGPQEFPINVECDIQPVFTLNVTPPPGGVSFTHVMANSPPQEQEVMVTVLSNLHAPYEVQQDLQTNMTNNQGKEFNNKYFNVEVQIPPGQNGQTNFTEFSTVQTGEHPLFSSDAAGDGATFKVVYRLQGYSQMNAGDFLAPVRLSLNQK